MKNFVSGIIQDITVSGDGNHAALIAYSTSTKLEFDFNTLQGSDVTAAGYDALIQKMPLQKGLTFIDKALLLANEKIFTASGGMRGDVAKVNIVVLFRYSKPFSFVCVKITCTNLSFKHTGGMGRTR